MEKEKKTEVNKNQKNYVKERIDLKIVNLMNPYGKEKEKEEKAHHSFTVE